MTRAAYVCTDYFRARKEVSQVSRPPQRFALPLLDRKCKVRGLVSLLRYDHTLLSEKSDIGQLVKKLQWTHIYTHMHTHIHTYTYTHTHTHIHTYTHMHTHTHTHACTHIYTRTHTCTHIHTHIHTPAHTYTHVHTHAHTYTHTHTQDMADNKDFTKK